MVNIKIYFYKNYTNNIISRLIHFFQTILKCKEYAKYTHVELQIGETSYSSSFMDGGVRKKNINYDESHWDFIEMIISEEEMFSILDFFEEQEGKKYDLRNIFLSQFFNFKNDNCDKWVCSELVTKLLSFVSGIKLNNKPYEYSPCELARELIRNNNMKIGC